MAQHKTHKDTIDGKATTKARRAARERKHAGPALDLDRLLIDLTNEAAARRAANLTDN